MDAATVAGQEPVPPFPATLDISIVCPVRLLRDGLIELLEAEPRLNVVAHAGTGEEALADICRTPPDIVLIDAALPQGPAMVRRFRQADPRVRSVPFAVEEGLEAAALWLEAGAAALVRRSASLAELVGVLHGIMRPDGVAGKPMPQPDPLLPVDDGSRSRFPEVPNPPRLALTRRERQVLEQIYAGCSNKEIARCLGIEPATVKCHVHNLLGKLNVDRRSQAAVWMREHEANPVCCG